MRKFTMGAAAVMLCAWVIVQGAAAQETAEQTAAAQETAEQTAVAQERPEQIAAAQEQTGEGDLTIEVLPRVLPAHVAGVGMPAFDLVPNNDIYLKLNGLYALAGVINPSVEFGLSKHSTFQAEIVFSPWSSVRDNGVSKPMLFGIFTNEYRYYPKMHNDGWYFGVNASVIAFNMTKPSRHNGYWLKDNSSKGYGYMFSVVGGYEWQFGRDKRWLLDASVGFGYTLLAYNGYALVDGIVEGGHTYNKGEIILTPHRSVQPAEPDPWNKSAQWIPTRAAVSVGYKIFDPVKKARDFWSTSNGGGPMWMR